MFIYGYVIKTISTLLFFAFKRQ